MSSQMTPVQQKAAKTAAKKAAKTAAKKSAKTAAKKTAKTAAKKTAAKKTAKTTTKKTAKTATKKTFGGNPDLEEELSAILGALKACFFQRQRASNDKKGGEREVFVSACLESILPAGFRFGKGDVCDLGGRKSGSIDIVIENAYMPSLAHPATPRYRHYIAEGVAACIEVKSDLRKQWSEVRATANKLGVIHRAWGRMVSQGSVPQGIPLFAVGFSGWKSIHTLRDKVVELGLAGILAIESEIFVCHPGWAYGAYLAEYYIGPWSLWGLSCALTHFSRALRSTTTSPEAYALSHLTMLSNIICRFIPQPPENLNLLELEWLQYSPEMKIEFADRLHLEGFLEHAGDGKVKLNMSRIEEEKRLFGSLPVF